MVPTPKDPHAASKTSVASDTTDTTDRGTPDFGGQLFGLRKSPSTFSHDTSVSESADGCIVLGQDASRGNKYVTRFRIDRTQQRSQRLNNVIKEECCGCLAASNRASWKLFLWAVISGEPLLLTLHLSAITIGATKEGLNLRQVASTLHLVASTIETFVACLIIAIRIVQAWMSFAALRAEHASIEYVGSAIDVRTPGLRKGVISFTVYGLAVLGADITAYFLFYFLAHLGWTILSNNSCIILISLVAGLIDSRIKSEIDYIKGDQHKAVIYEAVLLLTECAWANSAEEKKRIFGKIDRFCKALRDTDMFQKPDYITIPKDVYPHTNLLSQLQLQSVV